MRTQRIGQAEQLSLSLIFNLGFPGGATGKEHAYQCRTCKRHGFNPCLGREDSLEEGMATHSSILAWRASWTEEVGYSPWDWKELDATEAT